ncbi:hypothetical protein [Streptomyces canus]|uniref:hypothetical protein n=1 Tax=Streptomyces canus TaxID=58343 RepID=UPI002E30272C|nr:hypothetical protein [Streptomyces canus]
MGIESWIDDLLGGGGSGFGGGGGIPMGGLSGAWSFALSHYFAQAPGPLGPILTTYFTSGINFDDPSDLAEAMSMLDAVAPQRRGADDHGDSRNTRGELLQTVAYGEMGIDEPMAVSNRAIGEVDQANGLANSSTGRSESLGFDTGLDGGSDGGRQLDSLSREGSPQVGDTAEETGERNLLGTSIRQPDQSDQAEAARLTRPENAQPARPETDASPSVSLSSSLFYGFDTSGNPVYVVGTPLTDNKPEQVYGPPRPPSDESIVEVHVRGVRPPRPPQTPPARPENSTETRELSERGFWNRGGAGLVVGTGTAVVGAVIIFSNPIGWVIGLGGALMLASGAAASLSSALELGASYAGKTTPVQDEAMNKATNAALGTSSPAGFLGGVAGTVYTGDSSGFEEGAFWGGLAEGAISLGTGIGRMSARELRFGNPRNMSWERRVAGEIPARTRNQQVYGLGDAAARSRHNPDFPGSVERIELSHFLQHRPTKNPNSVPARLRRMVGPGRYERIVNRPFNVTPMWGTDHALIDPDRYRPMKASFKLLNQQLTGPARWSRFAPPWFVQSAYGGTRIGLTVGGDLLTGDADSGSDPENFSLPDD